MRRVLAMSCRTIKVTTIPAHREELVASLTSDLLQYGRRDGVEVASFDENNGPYGAHFFVFYLLS